MVVMTATVFTTLVACSGQSTPPINSGTIVQIVKHDDVEARKKVCTASTTIRTKVKGVWKSKKKCESYKNVTKEVSAETYDFELVSGNNRGWVLGVPEHPGESYEEGDIYP
jgi:hypothetical protein